MSAPEARYWLTTKSSIDSAKTISRLAPIAGSSSGSSTRRTTSHGGAPRSAAASSRSVPMVARRPRTITTTNDSENVTWPIACAVVPSPMNLKAVVNSRKSPTAKTSSGVTSGSSVSTFAVPEPRPRQRCSPSASATPSGVAISIASAASSRLCTSAWLSVGSCSTLRFGSCVNHRIDQPWNELRERPALNAKRIASSTGTIDQAM